MWGEFYKVVKKVGTKALLIRLLRLLSVFAVGARNVLLRKGSTRI